jgi:hypothetical protein
MKLFEIYFIISNCTDVPNPKRMFENTCDIWRAYGVECQEYVLLRCDVVSLVDGTNVSVEPALCIFFSEDRGSIMFRNTCINIAV